MTDELDLVDKIAEKLKSKDYSNELNSLSEKLDSLQEVSSHTHSHDEGKPMNQENDKHEHSTHSWDKTCSDCGEDNPDFTENQYHCVDCEKPMGTKEEASKAKACPHCSSTEGAYNEEEGFGF